MTAFPDKDRTATTGPHMQLKRPITAITLLASLCATFSGALAFDETKYPDWKGGWRRVAVPGITGQPSMTRRNATAWRRRRRSRPNTRRSSWRI
jgi:hypothetical protein